MAGQGHVGRTDVSALERFLAESATAAPSRYAFVRRGRVICFYADSAVALEAGAHCFPDREFSIIDVHARKVVLPH